MVGYVAQAGLNFKITLLPQTLKYRNYNNLTPYYFVIAVLWIKPKAMTGALPLSCTTSLHLNRLIIGVCTCVCARARTTIFLWRSEASSVLFCGSGDSPLVIRLVGGLDLLNHLTDPSTFNLFFF